MIKITENSNRIDGKIFIDETIVAVVNAYYGQSMNKEFTIALSTIDNDKFNNNYDLISKHLKEFIDYYENKQLEFIELNKDIMTKHSNVEDV